jgi:ABC-type uncharacterized transport system substrate-binding protein
MPIATALPRMTRIVYVPQVLRGKDLKRSSMSIGRRLRHLMAAAVFGGSVLSAPREAAAHPHVFLTQTVSIVFDRGAITALDHVWYFDEFYTAMAVEGLDKNKDGVYSRDELQELAKVNIEGLREFNYYTFAKLAGADLKLGMVTDYWLEHANGVLALHFRVPLDQPVLGEAKGFEFSVYDPTYFVAFDYKDDKAIRISEAAPKACRASIAEPEKTAADARRLGESFFEQLGGGPGAGVAFAKTVKVECAA